MPDKQENEEDKKRFAGIFPFDQTYIMTEL